MKEKLSRLGRIGGNLADGNLFMAVFLPGLNGVLGPLANVNAKGCRSFSARQKSLRQNT
jgi:hypothetical protein